MQQAKFLIATLSFFIFVLLPHNAAVAQTHYESNISIGVKGGTTFSMIGLSPSVPQTMLMGTTMGVSFRYIEERNFGFIVELNMMQRGWKEKFEYAPQYSYQRRLTYLHLPFLTHIYFGSHKFRGFFNAGPELCFMIGDSYDSNFDINNLPDFNDDYRETEQFDMEVNSKFDYGISAGLGMEFILKNKHSFLLEGRYYFGIGNVFGSSKSDHFGKSNGSSITVTLGYMFRLK
ncbi:MAG TPA: PorT family protein [Candidatus Avimuribaculum pullicola]|nr:PorT family protein [Candidatus Avimuribaculum pullicola]